MSELTELESTAALWDWVSRIALIIALVAAVLEVITNWTNWIKSPWKSRVEKTAVLLVFFGSAAGLVATWKLSNINEQIIAILNTRVATAQKEAGEAMTTAANAQTRLEEQRERTAKVEGAVAEAQAQARKFEAEIASSNARAEEAKKIAERERLERVKLEAQIAPRRLTSEQQKAIAASLKRFNGRQVKLITYTLDLEAAVLAGQIKTALVEAGIRVDDQTSNVMPVGRFHLGIWVNGPPVEQDLVNAVFGTLVQDGKLAAINTGTKPGAANPADGVNILVGVKPLSPKPK
jgi:hypothetical protein